ncbi:MAG TPA: hypothetical protein VES89_03610, partial [Candidatus Competibacteraceae bacterium]|nr:hypothetical protein [Candidatus Competibacteraceae bacterium]
MPLLLGGLGEIGRIVAERFLAMLQPCPNVGNHIQLFQPLPTPAEEAPDPLGRWSQEASTQGQPIEVEVAMLLAGWQFAEVYADAIERIDRSLTAAAPIKPVLTLIVLLPPPEDQVAHAHACNALPAIERLIASLTIPGRILVFPATASAQQTDTVELMEALFRALIDAEITELLHDHIRQPGGRPMAETAPGYGTLTVQRLCSHQTALLEHLEARFQQDLFWRGLMNLNRLSAAERKTLQARAQQFLRDCAAGFEEQYHHFPEVVANLPATAPDPAEVQQIQDRFEAEFTTAAQQIEARLNLYFAALEQQLREEFAAVLDDNSAGLAGGRYYLEALTTGLQNIREEFCRKPLQTGVTSYYEARLEKLIASFRLPVKGAGQQPTTTVRTLVASLHTAVSQSTAVDHIPARFLASSWDQLEAYLQQEAPNVGDAQGMLSSSCALFLAKVLPLAEQLQALQRRRQETLREPVTSTSSSISWIRWLLPGTRSDSKPQNLRDSLNVLEQGQTQFQGIYANLYRFYLGLVSELLWPQIVRVLIVEGFSHRLHSLALEFTAFWAGVGAACTERLRDADYPLEGTDPTTISILGRAQLDKLYAATVGATEWPEYAAKALVFQPGALIPSSASTVTLWEHFKHGPARLLQRLAEFTAIRFTLLSTRDALELLELDGTEPARELLRQAASRAQSRQPTMGPPAAIRRIY